MRIDRVVLGIVVLGALLGAVLANAQSEVDSTPGLLAARAWLNDLDTGRYGRAYDEASPTLQGSMTRVQWETGLERGRGPLGVSITRKIRTASCTKGTKADPEAQSAFKKTSAMR